MGFEPAGSLKPARARRVRVKGKIMDIATLDQKIRSKAEEQFGEEVNNLFKPIEGLLYYDDDLKGQLTSSKGSTRKRQTHDHPASRLPLGGLH